MATLSKVVYPNLRCFLALEHPHRTDETFGRHCIGTFAEKTDVDIRGAALGLQQHIEAGGRRGDAADPAAEMGVIGSAATLQLSYFNAADGVLLEPMHLSANLGKKPC